MAIPRWARGPFELLVQAELHFRGPTEQDRRLACILFDNCVEISIVSYVHLDKTQRRGRQLASEAKSEVIKGFHSAIKFCCQEIGELGCELESTFEDFIYYHRMRNEQYHGGTLTVPGIEDTRDLRTGAMQVFAYLFSIQNLSEEVEDRIMALTPKPPMTRDEKFDKLIDDAYELVAIGDNIFTPSETLFSVDPNAYRELGQELVAENLFISSDQMESVN